MKIEQLRQGFATNSSSSHSVVFAGHGHKYDHREADHTHSFGWERFCLTDQKSKRRYFAAQIFEVLQKFMPEPFARACANDVAGIEIPDDDDEVYVDHQSVWALPCEWDGRGVDVDFLADLRAYLDSDAVVIFGGNDNDNTYYKGDKPILGLPTEWKPEEMRQMVGRKEGQSWTLFHRDSGNKIKISFDPQNDEAGTSRERPSAPELIDVKVTDWCPFGCSFCYQDSTTAGKHADINKIWDLASWCRSNKVFEVALGGGEPTMHPRFVEILGAFRHAGVIPNFTTKSLAWMRDEEGRPEILSLIGGFAFSAESASDVDKASAIFSRHPALREKATVHVVMGIADRWEFENILNACVRARLPVTLLGWKSVGRGADVEPVDYSWWLDAIVEMEKIPRRIGIDTVLASESAEQLRKYNIPHQLYYVRDGVFSWYIDAVNGEYGDSSFVPTAELPKEKNVRDRWDFSAAWSSNRQE